MDSLTTLRPVGLKVMENIVPAAAISLRYFSSVPKGAPGAATLNTNFKTPPKYSGGTSPTTGTSTPEEISPQEQTSQGAEAAVTALIMLKDVAGPALQYLLSMHRHNTAQMAKHRGSHLDGQSGKKPVRTHTAPKATTAREVRLRREAAAANERLAVFKQAASLVDEFAIVDKGVSQTLLSLVQETREIDRLLQEAPRLAKEHGLSKFETREYITELTHAKARATWLAQTFAKYEHVASEDIPDNLTEEYAQVGKFERIDPRHELRSSGPHGRAGSVSPATGSTDFNLVGDSYRRKNPVLNYKPLAKMVEKSESGAKAILKNTKFENMFDRVNFDKKGACYFTSSSDRHLKLMVSPDGKYIFSSNPKDSPAVLGSYKGTPDGGSLDSFYKLIEIEKTAYDGPKPGKYTLLNRSDADLAALKKLKMDFKEGVNRHFVDKSVTDHLHGIREFHTFTAPAPAVTDKRDGEETGYGWEIGQLPSYGIAVHRTSGIPVFGSEITDVLRAGGKLYFEKGRAYIDYVPQSEKDQSEPSTDSSNSDQPTNTTAEKTGIKSEKPVTKRES